MNFPLAPNTIGSAFAEKTEKGERDNGRSENQKEEQRIFNMEQKQRDFVHPHETDNEQK